MVHTIYMLQLSCCLISLIHIKDFACGLHTVGLLKALSQWHHVVAAVMLLRVPSLLIFMPYTLLDVGWNIGILGYWCACSPTCIVCILVNLMLWGFLALIRVILLLISAAFGFLVLVRQVLFVFVRKEVWSAHLSVVLAVTALDCMGREFSWAWRSLLLWTMVTHFIVTDIVFKFMPIFFLYIRLILLLHDFLNIVLDLILMEVLININDFIIIL